MKSFVSLLLAATLTVTAIADEARPWERNITPAALQADFEALYSGLQRAHADLYAHRSKDDYDAYFAAVRQQLDVAHTQFEAQVLFQRFTAYGNVAHARIDFPSQAYDEYRSSGGKSLPIYPRIVAGRAYVGENYSGNDDLERGAEILAINDQPMSEWLARTAAHLSADTPYIAHSLLEYQFPQYVWLEVGPVDEFTLRIRQPDGVERRITIAASTRADQRTSAERQPERFTLGNPLRNARMLDTATAYLRPGPFYNAEDPERVWDASAFVAFIDSAFESFIAAEATTLIIDLRDNPGGDSSFSDPMLAWIADEPFRFCAEFLIRSSDAAAASNQARIDTNAGGTSGVSALYAKEYARTPRGDVFAFDIPYAEPRDGVRFEGRVVALINRHTYSNAVNVAAIIQDYGFGTIAGEKTADMATTYGAMETFSLPATGITVGFPKAHIIRPSGDREVDGVTPDLVLLEPIVAGTEDVVLQTLRQRLEHE